MEMRQNWKNGFKNLKTARNKRKNGFKIWKENFFMQFIQAKRRDNKLNVRDNRPYAIDKVEFIKGGIGLYLTDFKGEKVYLTYSDLYWFWSDFTIVNSLKELEKYKEVL